MSQSGNWTKNFFFCHTEDTPYSHEFCVEPGHYAKVRFFADNDQDYRVAPQEGVSDCPCGPRRQWFNVRNIPCDVEAPDGCIVTETRPHVLAVNTCDDYAELDPGRYRFCLLDCNYNPIVPGRDDVLLRVQHCVDTRMRASQSLQMLKC